MGERADGEMPVMILAGGQSSRMGGGDKCLRPFAGRTMLHFTLDRLAPQTGTLALNANGDPARFADFGLAVHADAHADHPGPLVGILAAMRWAGAQGAPVVATVPSDAPFLPTDLLARLEVDRARASADIALAASGGFRHPVIGIWRTALADPLDTALSTGVRKVMHFAGKYSLIEVPFAQVPVGPHGTHIDPFFNANTPHDLAAAEGLISGDAAGTQTAGTP